MIVVERPFEKSSSRPKVREDIRVYVHVAGIQREITEHADVLRRRAVLEAEQSCIRTAEVALVRRLENGLAAISAGRTEDLTGLSDDELMAKLCS